MAFWAIVAGSAPVLLAPSESSTIAAGFCLASAVNALSSASPVAVPPLACRASSVALTCTRSCVGARTVCGPSANAMSPIWSWSGTLSKKWLPAAIAACSRLGLTSVAFIEPLVSVTNITLAFSTGTATVASGRASATAIAASAVSSRAGGTLRRTLLDLGITAATVAAAGNRITYLAGLRRAKNNASSAIGTTASPARNRGA